MAALFALASYADDQCEAWPSINTLANDLGVDERNARATLKALRLAGVVSIIGRGPHGLYKYRINISDRMKTSPDENIRSENPDRMKTSARPDENVRLDRMKTSCIEAMNSQRTSTCENDSDFALKFPLRGSSGSAPSWVLSADKLAEWSETWPTVNIDSELTKAAQWLRDNPDRRKTPRGMLRFLSSWIARGVERGTAAPRSERDSLPGANIQTCKDVQWIIGDDDES